MVVTHTLGRTKSDLCCANGPCRSDVWADFTTVCLHNDSFRQFDLQIAATALNQLFFPSPPPRFHFGLERQLHPFRIPTRIDDVLDEGRGLVLYDYKLYLR